MMKRPGRSERLRRVRRAERGQDWPDLRPFVRGGSGQSCRTGQRDPRCHEAFRIIAADSLTAR